MTEKISDNMLMALADRELEAPCAVALRSRIERDPDLARRYAAFRNSAEAVRAAYAAPLAEAPPTFLAEAIRSHPFPTAAAGRSATFRNAWSRFSTLPLAASIALAAGLGGYLIGHEETPVSRASLASLDQVIVALAGLPAGEVSDLGEGARAAVIASYDTDRGFCRNVQLREASGDVLEALGCLTEDGWRTVLVLPQTPGDTYLPADGAAGGAMGAYLASLGATDPLDPIAETIRIDQNWSPQGE